MPKPDLQPGTKLVRHWWDTGLALPSEAVCLVVAGSVETQAVRQRSQKQFEVLQLRLQPAAPLA